MDNLTTKLAKVRAELETLGFNLDMIQVDEENDTLPVVGMIFRHLRNLRAEIIVNADSVDRIMGNLPVLRKVFANV